MEAKWLGLIELLLVLGGVAGFGAWQLVSLRRERERDARRDARREAEREPERESERGQDGGR